MVRDLDSIHARFIPMLECDAEDCKTPARYVLYIEYGSEHTDSRIGTEIQEVYCKAHLIEMSKYWMKDNEKWKHTYNTPDREMIGALMWND